ncbi:CpsD/CapB family tyrosine-protein kinase [Anaerobacillus isosaccharinicus]|uniref:CpsD/CapB family tyrosine-protein kinase n=1 Tax=Anaerobacillus isosaccharinicus TaxID=1532552 RepID=A0A7S7RAK6_9BACI|nr:CpsD/CapB family tyrosine-protein kinase [Anaerobacillus isosaccharinicus]
MEHKRIEKAQLKEVKRSLISHFLPKSQVSEQYRRIRSAIQFASSKKEQSRIIAITSATSKEGKSTTAANLAVVFAQQQYKVLLIDADMRKPTCHYQFNVNNELGLTNVLLGNNDISGAIIVTTIPNLHLLSCGPIPHNPAELLGMKRMDWFLKEVRMRYDYIFIDTPPVLDVTDSQIIAEKSDGVVFVASSKTKIDSAKKAKNLIVKARGNLLGVVLNRS